MMTGKILAGGIFIIPPEVMEKLGLYAAGYVNNGAMIMPPMALILVGLLFLAGSSLFAEEAVKAEETVKTGETIKKENVFKQIASIQGRGAMNFLTAPGEFSAAFQTEKKAHPKAWLLTYPPRFFSNMAVRVGSSVNDILVLPWYVRWSEDTPLTKRFELPDYVWEKE